MEWIDVNTALPDLWFPVLVCWSFYDDPPRICRLNSLCPSDWVEARGASVEPPPTHWMPLPEPFGSEAQ